MQGEFMDAETHRHPLGSFLKRAAFAAMAVVVLVTIWVHERYVLRPNNPQFAHFAPFMWWLIPHVLTGALCLTLGVLQFSTTLRRRWPNVHRWIGRTYAVSALVSSSLALWIVLAYELPANQWVMGVMAGLWLITTALAWLSALNRRFDQHSLWAGRSYGLTFTFVTTRFIPDIVWPGMDYFGVTALYWVLIVMALILPDVLAIGDQWRRRRVRP